MRDLFPRARPFWLRLSLCLTVAAGLAGGWGRAETVERRLAAMGTYLGLRVEAANRQAGLGASEEAVAEISRVERLLSTWRPGGPLDRLNRATPGDSVAVGHELADLLVTVETWSRRTEGAFDATVFPLVRAWGLRDLGRVPLAEERRRALAAVGGRHFRIDSERGEATRLSPDAGIDEGAWGKGYALDTAAARLRRNGVREAVLDLGGQLLAIGEATVAVADPRRRDRPAVSLLLVDGSVSTSSNSERGLMASGRRIGHLLDPRTGEPAPDFGSATAIARSGL